MKQVTILTAAIVLAILAAGAPAAWAGEIPPAAAVSVPHLEQAAQAVIQAPDAIAPAASPRDCGDQLEARVVEGAAASCNFGAPRCTYGGQCDSWCFPMYGVCLSGCCACT